jgi:hypothetical protein
MTESDSSGEVQTKRGRFIVRRRPNAHGSNLADQEQPTIIVTGPGMYEFIGRWTTLCGVPGAASALNAMDATDEQIVWALTHDESIFA